MSKKPKTPDVAAVWHEVKGISNGLAALRITVACNQNETAKHDAWIKGLQNAEIDAQGIGEQIGDLEVRVGNLEPLHAAVSMLEAKVAALTERAERVDDHIGAIISRLDDIAPLPKFETIKCVGGKCQVRDQAFDTVAGLAKLNADLCRLSQVDANRVCYLNRECGTVRSVVTVLVIVQVFSIIAGLAWVLGVGK